MQFNDRPTAATRRSGLARRVQMQTPEDVAVMLELRRRGWGTKRIARELGISRNTVRRYMRNDGWAPYKVPRRDRALDGLDEWLADQFRRHGGNAEVVRQELLAEHGVAVSLRTVERAVQPLRAQLRAEARATLRFETLPGKQMQVDFGTKTVRIAGVPTRVKIFTATLGYSRRLFVYVSLRERAADWFAGMEAAFMHFGGVPETLLVDNAKALVDRHDVQTREVVFTRRFVQFCKHWGVTPKACAPYRARTKGKTERAVGYTKRNGLAGREFDSWEGMVAHLGWWMREIADVRDHGTTGERPIDRFEAEQAALQPLPGRGPFEQVRELRRKVSSDCFADVDTNRYSAPWRLSGTDVTALVTDTKVILTGAGVVIAEHERCFGRGQWLRQSEHFEGIGGRYESSPSAASEPAESELQRPLDAYEAAMGGAW